MADPLAARTAGLNLLSPIAEHTPSPSSNRQQRERDATYESSRYRTASQATPNKSHRHVAAGSTDSMPRPTMSGAHGRPVPPGLAPYGSINGSIWSHNASTGQTRQQKTPPDEHDGSRRPSDSSPYLQTPVYSISSIRGDHDFISSHNGDSIPHPPGFPYPRLPQMENKDSVSYEHHQMQIQLMQLIHERQSIALQHKRMLEDLYRLQQENTSLRAAQMRLDSSPPLHTQVLGSSFTPFTPINMGGKLLLQSPGFFGTSPEDHDESVQRESGLATDDGEFVSAPPIPGRPLNDWTPPRELIDAVLGARIDYTMIHPSYIRGVVWVLAYKTPRDNGHHPILRETGNAIGLLFVAPSSPSTVRALTDAVMEYSLELCCTASGNHLCQQLLEKVDMEDKLEFLAPVIDNLISISNSKYGTHVLNRAASIKELERFMEDALVEKGVFETMASGARRLWSALLEKSKINNNEHILEILDIHMKGRWAGLACQNEHGSISVQQVLENTSMPSVIAQSGDGSNGFRDRTRALYQACLDEILSDISRVANNPSGHFVIVKRLAALSSNDHNSERLVDALIEANPPVALSHQGVNFVKQALTELQVKGDMGCSRYIRAICSTASGTPGLINIASTAVGKQHLAFLIPTISLPDYTLIRNVSESYSTTLRACQAGNDFIRFLTTYERASPASRTGPRFLQNAISPAHYASPTVSSLGHGYSSVRGQARYSGSPLSLRVRSTGSSLHPHGSRSSTEADESSASQ